MLFYLIRHGESEGNLNQVHSGWGAWNLTEKGRQQALAVGERLRKLPPFDQIYVSDLVRTRQTFELAFGADTPHILSPLIREINTAPFVGLSIPMLRETLGKSYTDCTKNMDYSPYGGECGEHMKARVKAFYDRVTAQDPQPERVAVVCHGGVIRCTFAIATGMPARDVRIVAGNCGVTVLKYEEGVWRLIQLNHTPEIYQ